MPSPEDVFEAIEADRAQRELEVRLIENLAQRARNEGEKSSLRRSLTMVTYAHLEGFCKFALLAYKGAVNAANIACSEVVTPIAAATLSNLFAALRDLNSKDPVFRKSLPDDRDVHLLWRERVFIEEFRGVLARPVAIPDRVVDTKSNLNSVVLKRNLYLLGLPSFDLAEHETTINELLGRRNAIAHGDRATYPSEVEVRRFITSSFSVMQFLQTEIYEALRYETYKREAA